MITKSIAIVTMVFLVQVLPCRADLRFETADVDLGELGAGLRVSRELMLTNTGPETVVILEVRGSCGCLAPRVEPARIPPGGKARLDVRLNTLGEGAGPHSWKASVRYRQAGGEKQVQATFQARIITEITVQPASLTLVTQGGISQTIVLTDHRSLPMSITSVASSAGFLKSRLLEQGKDAHGCWTAKIGIDIDRDIPAGRHDQVVSVYSADPLYGELRIPVVIVKTPPASKVTVDPPCIEFSRDEQTSSRLVRLRSAHGMRVEKIQADDPALTCKWVNGPNGEIFLKIQADVPRLKTAGRAFVHVHLAEPAGEVLAIPVLLDSEVRETAER